MKIEISPKKMSGFSDFSAIFFREISNLISNFPKLFFKFNPDSDFLDRKHIQETFVGVYTTPLTSQPVFLLKTSAVDHLIASRGSWIGRRFRCKIHKSLGISGI